jgi:hypothetical protein
MTQHVNIIAAEARKNIRNIVVILTSVSVGLALKHRHDESESANRDTSFHWKNEAQHPRWSLEPTSSGRLRRLDLSLSEGISNKTSLLGGVVMAKDGEFPLSSWESYSTERSKFSACKQATAIKQTAQLRTKINQVRSCFNGGKKIRIGGYKCFSSAP